MKITLLEAYEPKLQLICFSHRINKQHSELWVQIRLLGFASDKAWAVTLAHSIKVINKKQKQKHDKI